jgi:hypothetical protein
MAKKSSPVFYCGFCDMALKNNEGIFNGGKHFCNEQCVLHFQDKNKCPFEEELEVQKRIIFKLRQGTFNFKLWAKDRYLTSKTHYLSSKKINPRGVINIKLECCVCCHIANGDKVKALHSLEEFKERTIDELQEISDGKSGIRFITEREKKTNSEALRIYGQQRKNQVDIYELCISQL